MDPGQHMRPPLPDRPGRHVSRRRGLLRRDGLRRVRPGRGGRPVRAAFDGAERAQPPRRGEGRGARGPLRLRRVVRRRGPPVLGGRGPAPARPRPGGRGGRALLPVRVVRGVSRRDGVLRRRALSGVDARAGGPGPGRSGPRQRGVGRVRAVVPAADRPAGSHPRCPAGGQPDGGGRGKDRVGGRSPPAGAGSAGRVLGHGPHRPRRSVLTGGRRDHLILLIENLLLMRTT
mmetsp:Transcript_32722/g.73608  ORF Transcript_32722/g.73608 Transcript_32722/m.73608 type:complete len:231 (+) Transcript_32722:769-1461(+)